MRLELPDMPNGIIPNNPNTGGALNAEHYQSFEMAKEHDSVLGGTDIAQIRSYAAYARAQAQAIHKTIAATSGIDDVAAIKQEATETAQTFAKVGIYADQRIGEILRDLPTRQGKRTDTTLSATQDEVTKRQAMSDAGISKSQAYDLQAMAANPDVVQAVLEQAEADGRIPSRSQVLKAIQERDDARFIADKLKKQRDEAREDAEGYGEEIQGLQEEIRALEAQADKEYENGFKAGERHGSMQAQSQVVTSEVVPEDYKESKLRINELEHLERVHTADNQKLRKQLEEARKELEQAKGILGMNQTMHDVRRDVHYLISATNQYVRQYGGLTWTVQQLADVDAPTLEELRKAVSNLATFSHALVTSLEGFTDGR